MTIGTAMTFLTKWDKIDREWAAELAEKTREGIRKAEVVFYAKRKAAGVGWPAVTYSRLVLRQCRKYTDTYLYTAGRVITNEEVMQAMRDDGLEPDEYQITIMDVPEGRLVV